MTTTPPSSTVDPPPMSNTSDGSSITVSSNNGSFSIPTATNFSLPFSHTFTLPFGSLGGGSFAPPSSPAVSTFIPSPSAAFDPNLFSNLNRFNHTPAHSSFPLQHFVSGPFGANLNLSQHATVKLDRTNYLLWRYSILPIIKGYKLDGHLSGTKPPELLQVGNLTHVNPGFEDWNVTDQLLLGWLLGSMTQQALIEVVGCKTAADVWRTLETLYNNQAESRILEYKEALTKTSKGNKSMADYLAQMKGFSDNLATAGYPVQPSELVLATLGGLPKEYEAVIVNITSRVGSLSWPEVQAQLLTHERWVAKFHSPAPDLALPSANAVFQRSPVNRNQPARESYSTSPVPNSPRGRGNFRGGGRHRGRGGRNFSTCRGNDAGRSTTTCQICKKSGHSATTCWYRFEDSQPRDHQSNARQVSAYLASPDLVYDPSWYVDSGASNHITSDQESLHNRSDYNGNDSLIVGQNNQPSSSSRYT